MSRFASVNLRTVPDEATICKFRYYYSKKKKSIDLVYLN